MLVAKITFPPTGVTDFVIYFPLFFTIGLVTAQLIMESSTIYNSKLLHLCIPEKAVATKYVRLGEDVAARDTTEVDGGERSTFDNPVVE